MPATTLVHATVLRNISGKTLFFGYLGINGAFLDDGDDIAVPGNIWSNIYRSQQKTDSLRADLQNGIIVILQSPVDYIYDTGDNTVKHVKSVSGVLTADPILPSGGSYVGPPIDVPDS
jgi:hypothetical protein